MLIRESPSMCQGIVSVLYPTLVEYEAMLLMDMLPDNYKEQVKACKSYPGRDHSLTMLLTQMNTPRLIRKARSQRSGAHGNPRVQQFWRIDFQIRRLTCRLVVRSKQNSHSATRKQILQ